MQFNIHVNISKKYAKQLPKIFNLELTVTNVVDERGMFGIHYGQGAMKLV